MIELRPVLEILTPDDFTLWPVGTHEPFGFLPLGGAMSPADVGAAVARLAVCNDTGDDSDDSGDSGDSGDDALGEDEEDGEVGEVGEDEEDGEVEEVGSGMAEAPARPADPVGAFLHGLLTAEDVIAPGGFRVTDTATGVTLLPGCCSGLEDWREWQQVLDGDGYVWLGHDPTASARREGAAVRLTPDEAVPGGPVIELPVEELRRLVARAERDLAGFVALADVWAARHAPHHRALLTAALARALGLGPAEVSAER
ncbi:hypothetical protein OH807_10990 [Kitasatospora sp. NBC_01560]|uniref:hypothetical protein n=1 Tax=Kitasatospora sp. NBC_01560 TaxID=2975965 RepID=UPI00386B4864